MTNQPSTRIKMTAPRFHAAKAEHRKLSMLTAYDYLWAGLFDRAGVDSILVGDSMGMVVQGKATTLPVTLDEIIYHAEMVTRAVKWAMVVVDLPFMSYQLNAQQAIQSAGRILKETGAAAVKLEGGQHQAETIAAISQIGIPVMGHVGMMPQSVQQLGGLGRIQRDRERLLSDALAAEQAGAFAIVLELIPREIAKAITDRLSIPTIGIGAGPDCDGQVLVSQDMLGLTSFTPKYLKIYAHLGDDVVSAVKNYVADVRDGTFPSDEQSHH